MNDQGGICFKFLAKTRWEKRSFYVTNKLIVSKMILPPIRICNVISIYVYSKSMKMQFVTIYVQGSAL